MQTLRTAASAILLLACAACQRRHQILIVNAQVIDGTGSPARPASVRIVGDEITAVGALTPTRADSVVDAHGLVLAPGFIDDHSHHDGGLFQHPEALAVVSQGITTIVVGQDGGSHLPLATYFDSLERTPAAINVASYSGHGTIRRAVMGEDYKRLAKPDEITRMQGLLRQDMAAGALGLSSGLEYDPGIYSNTDELIALAKVAAASNGRYISHMRNEEEGVFDAVHELLTIGREANLPVEVSHMKLAMKELWGQSTRLIAMLDSARAAGIHVTADIYPYTAWHSDLTVNFPKRDFDDTAYSRYVLREIVPADGLIMTSFAPHPDYVGQTLSQIASARKADAAVTLLNLIRESQQYADAHHLHVDDDSVQGVIGASMSEGDVDRIIQWPYTSFCTDGALDSRHPRGIGSYPRILGHFVREQHVLTLTEAIRKATSLAAANVGIADRGTIAPGFHADLVLFDPATVIDRATYTQPHLVSTGITRVWVNGQVVWTDGQTTANRPGQVVRNRKAKEGEGRSLSLAVAHTVNHWKETADIVSRLRVLTGASRHAALATVVRTEGSAYRRAGARLLVADTGETVGSVSSGCLEADVREVARGVMATGRPTLRHYDAGVDNDSIAGLGLGCNGAVDVFVQPATSPQFIRILGPLCHALAGDEPITIATVIDGAHAGSIVLGDADVSSDGPVFIETLVPPPHLLVCGAGDDSIPLLAYATDAGFRVTVYDRRIVDPALPPPERTLAVVKTHSFAHDREWVRLFLSTGVPYIGVMGPRDRTDRILRELGASRDRIFGPVGLDLGAEGAHQIAISIVAELLAFTRG